MKELKSLRVKVENVLYMPSLEAPEEKPHPFVYFITISNDSKQEVTLLGRKWIITESDGQRTVVEGDGVVGKKPQIKPGESFSYNSYHITNRNGVAEGAFFGVTSGEEQVFTRIPVFDLEIPHWA